MKQWLVRRGLFATIPVAAVVVLALDACSSESGHPKAGTTTTEQTTGELKETPSERELPTSDAARGHLARVAQFSRIVAVSHEPAATAASGSKQKAAASAGLQLSAKAGTTFEAQPVVARGELDHFVRRADRIYAQLSESQRRTAVRPASIDLPATAEGFVRIQAEGNKGAVEFAAVGAKAGAPIETADGLINYPGGAPHGGDMVLRVGRESVEDFIVIEERPRDSHLDYRVKVEGIAGLRLYANTLEFLDKDGDPQIGVGSPSLVDADGKPHRATLELPDCAADHEAEVPWGRPVTAPGASECTVRVRWDDSKVVYPAIVDPVWSTPGALKNARYKNAAATQALTGNVITCGGIDINTASLTSCEVFNPAGNSGAGSWAAGPTLVGTDFLNPGTVGRQRFTMISIGNDTLAVGDAQSKTSERLTGSTWKKTATDFSTGNFDLNTLQPLLTTDGKYVVIIDTYGQAFKYDVAADAWSAGATLNSYRYAYISVAVPGGAIFRCGGNDNTGTTLKTCDKYTPSTNLWSAAPSLAGPRYNAAWAPIDPTHLIVYGGYNQQAGSPLPSVETYTSTTNTWATNSNLLANTTNEYYLHNSYALHAGTGKILSTAFYQPQIYDPTTQSWASINNYDGTTYFNTFYYSDAGLASVGSKVLLAPVWTGNTQSASTSCRLFDFVAQGGTCSQTTDCKSGLTCVYDNYFYSDGQSVCCDTTCTDPCSSCRAAGKESKKDEGTCGPRDHLTYVGYTNCPSTAQTTCGTSGGYCDGKGACAKWDTNSVCVNSSCADGDTQNNVRYCDGKGACGAATTTDCGTGYACVNYGQSGQCVSSCGSDTDCAANYYCQYWTAPLNTCQPRKANGKTCSNGSATECASGFCVDGVCCDKACNGLCEGCSNALTGKTNGTCSPIPNGQASNRDCTDQGSASCGQTGVCDGKGGCAKYASGTQCANIGACASETSRYVPDLCDGSGVCVDKGTQNCNAGYSCQAGVCNTSCTVDANCASNYFCDTTTNTCVADHAQGQTCKSASQCVGNVNCVDGVCCDSACTGTCRSCLKNRTGLAADGICGNTLDDTDPENECATDVGYPASCKAPGMCDGSGSCRVYAKPGIVAKQDTCSGTTLSAYTCDGAGNLTQVESPCYPFKCNAGGTACRVSCSKGTEKTDCDDTSFCGEGGKCVGVLPLGTACTDASQCKSGFCADIGKGKLESDPDPVTGAGGEAPVDTADHPGVCCDQFCGGSCEGCKKSTKGQGSDGSCAAVADHYDLKGDCQPDAANPCGHNGECDGSRGCRNTPNGTSCGTTTCIGNTARGQICSEGACINDSAIACSPYLCRDVNGAHQCTNPCSGDTDCQDGFYCDSKECKKKLSPGATCESSALCASGFCVDGVCCDVSCKGQCEACDVPGSEGVCSPVSGDPHGNRVKCDHAGETCGGQCDGVNSASCKYAAVGTTCGDTTCDNGLSKSSACDGQGECRPNKDAECSPYACGPDDTCLSRCEQDADCSDGYTCNETNGRCLPANATCSKDRQSSEGNGQSTPCKPFLCVPSTGTCAVTCAFSTDCADGFVCEPSSKTCLPAPEDTGEADAGSCACRVDGAAPASRNASNYWALAALGVALTGLRRRRRTRPTPAELKTPRFAQASNHFE